MQHPNQPRPPNPYKARNPDRVVKEREDPNSRQLMKRKNITQPAHPAKKPRNVEMTVLPIQKAILAGLTGIGSFAFAYNISRTWDAQRLSTKKEADLQVPGRSTAE